MADRDYAGYLSEENIDVHSFESPVLRRLRTDDRRHVSFGPPHDYRLSEFDFERVRAEHMDPKSPIDSLSPLTIEIPSAGPQRLANSLPDVDGRSHTKADPKLRYLSTSHVSYAEMRAFIGLVLAMGIVKKSSIESYWEASGISETPNFRDVMSRNRFQAILRYLHCSDNTTAVPRGQPGYDPLHKINPVVEFFNEVFELNYREQLLQYLQQLDKSQQVTLASTKDTVIPKESCASGWLISACDNIEGCYTNIDLCNNNNVMLMHVVENISIVQLLLKHKPDINAQTDDGGDALYFSALNGFIDITQLLLENNADCNICMHSKTASSNVRDFISDKTVDYGFDVVVSSSPLHIACFMGRTDVVHCLLNYHVNINITKEDGDNTIILCMCEVGHEDIVRLLLDKEADTQICRLDGRSPLNIATDNGHSSIVKMLTEHIKKEETLSS
ncbi:unnamed protein product [Mytilus edulis]|uniref:PiggyBac transposable element-derived protein domain-containing protein n=1 Tax=Mytilus edulis TaxID=6550 RepID=A0A8S3UB94_MYTED|nr:unnamed protein product [Mytilus edulis]